LVALTAITDATVKQNIKAVIDTIQPGGSTAIGDAAQRALNDLLAYGHDDESKVVFLLTDGLSNYGVDPLSVIPGYKSAHIPIFTFGYGSDADTTTLRAMADQTGGKFFLSPSSATE